MSGPLSFLSGLIKPVSDLVDNLHTSDEERLEAKSVLLELQTGLMSQTLAYEQAYRLVTVHWDGDSRRLMVRGQAGPGWLPGRKKR